MTVALWRKGGDIFFDNTGTGAPLAGGALTYYQAGTTTLAQTWQDVNGTILNANPVQLDANGRTDVPIYFGSAYNYKELLQDVNGNTIVPWPFDNLPAAQAAAQQQTGFERLYLPWTQVSAASSPVTLTVAAGGNGYEANCASGNVNFNLPAAAASGMAGIGYFFKRTDGTVANSCTVTPNGSDNIDGVNSPITIGAGYQGVYLVSDGAQWLTYSFYSAMARQATTAQNVTASGSSLNVNMALGWYVNLTLSANVSTFTVSNWPASGQLAKLQLRINNTGSFNISAWPGTTIWPNSAAPTITPNGIDSIMLVSTNGGTNFDGYVLGQAL
jgi:hypothetical protein